ncbi:MAG: Cof-type HAD-IIB family hydrolase [Candidatus Pacebacteria bacterium]|jgi:hypothetical protein|nr:Cof-type HAD-IIB family hydrolase [Candidatus Paceibacterota bacterium]
MKSEIRAVVLDVDGILVGFKGGKNFPDPCPEIIAALKNIKESGTPVILCTGRPFYAPTNAAIIKEANLNNFHIGDMGSLTMNPLSGEIFECKTVSQEDSSRLVQQLLQEGIVTNFFTPESYFVQEDQAGNKINQLLSASVQITPEAVESLVEAVCGKNVLYVSGESKESGAKEAMERIYRGFSGRLNLLWGNNLFLEGYHYGFFGPAGISKATGLERLIGDMGIPFENVLGAGDGVVDWEFMKLCGYRATLENAVPQVLENVSRRDKERNFIGPHVDQNGILEVLRHFGLM